MTHIPNFVIYDRSRSGTTPDMKSFDPQHGWVFDFKLLFFPFFKNLFSFLVLSVELCFW